MNAQEYQNQEQRVRSYLQLKQEADRLTRMIDFIRANIAANQKTKDKTYVACIQVYVGNGHEIFSGSQYQEALCEIIYRRRAEVLAAIKAL